jgi:hypothetical protein
MVRDYLKLLPFLNPSSATTTAKQQQQQTVTGSSMISPTVRVRIISPNVNIANAVLNLADPVIVVDPLNVTNLVDTTSSTAPEAPMRINRRHSSINGRKL